jgi:DNA-binding NarL/FixJ family response regulator
MPPTDPISVTVVDDNRVAREALVAMLAPLPDMSVAASAFIDFTSFAETRAHVVLLDVGLRDQTTLRVVTTLMNSAPMARIILMDIIPMNEEIVEFVNAGVCGFVVKDATFDEFVATIRSVAVGHKVLPPPMADLLFSQITKRWDVGRPRGRARDGARMTPREHEVIELIGGGLSNKEIAERLSIATTTVKNHVRNIMEKLELHSRLQISVYARRERSE